MAIESKIKALMEHLDCNAEEVGELIDDYSVLTEAEANEAFRESMENYIQECILPEIPSGLHPYFDTEMYIRDVRTSDGYGNTLAPYDGTEHEYKIDDTYYYIYRQN